MQTLINSKILIFSIEVTLCLKGFLVNYSENWTNITAQNFKLIFHYFLSIFDTKFNIVDFYPLTSKELLTNAINFAGTITTIDKKVVDTIMHSRKSLLFDNHEIWVKKECKF